MEGEVRAKAVTRANKAMNNMAKKLKNPKNYKQFFWSKDMEMFGFGAQNKIRDIKSHDIVSMSSENSPR